MPEGWDGWIAAVWLYGCTAVFLAMCAAGLILIFKEG